MNERPAPLDFRLFHFWVNQPPGRGVPRAEMVNAMRVTDPQQIRSSLTRLRKGEVSDPEHPGYPLRPLHVRWNSQDRLYYDLGKITGDNVDAQIPGIILSDGFGDLFTRAMTLQGGFGESGLERSVRELLSDPAIRDLIAQIPMNQMWRVVDTLRLIERARWMIETSQSRELLE